MRSLCQKFNFSFVIAVLSVFLLSACARIVGSARISHASIRSLSGVVQLARVQGSQIRVFALLANGQKGTLLAETTTNENGEYTVSLRGYSGHVIIESNGGTYNDEATGSSKTASSMSAVVEATQASNAPLTPLSSLVRERTLELFKNGTAFATAHETALSDVAKMFGIETEDLSVTPTDPSASSSTSLRGTRAALAIAAFSYLMKKLNEESSTEITVESAIQTLAADLKSDGKLDARNNGNLLDAESDLPFRLAVNWKNYLDEARTAFLQPQYDHLVFVNSISLAEVQSTLIDPGTENLNGMIGGIFYINGVDTGLANGNGTFLGRFYVSGDLANAFTNGDCFVDGVGTLASGTGTCVHDSKYYVNGAPSNGVYSGICYNNGTVTSHLDSNGTGLCSGNGKYYFENDLANGLMSNGKRYSNGDLFTGFEDNKFYKNGVIHNGVDGSSCFVDGVSNWDLDGYGSGLCSGDWKYYVSYQLANGVYSFMWQSTNVCYKDGVATTDLSGGEGVCSGNNKYYKNGSLGSGVSGSVCYVNGEATNDLDSFGTGSCSATGKFYVNGQLFTGVHNNSCYFNGDSQMGFFGGTGFCEVGGVNKYFVSGSLANEFVNGDCYVEGLGTLPSGTGLCSADSKYYVSGNLANEFVEGECYVNGVALTNGTGLCNLNNKYYFEGALHTGYGIAGQLGQSDRYYSEGVLANGRYDNGTCFVNGESQPESPIEWYVFGDSSSTPVKDSNLSNLENYWLQHASTYARCLPGASTNVYIRSPATSGTLTANQVSVESSVSGTAVINASVTFTRTSFSDGAIMSGGTINGDVTFGSTGWTSPDYSVMESGTINATTVSFVSNSIFVGGTINAQTIIWNGFTGNYSAPGKSYDGVYYANGVPVEVCSGDCYTDAQSLETGTERLGPDGAILSLVYANGIDGFKIWKEKNGNRILNATGLIENGWQKALNRAGTAFSNTDFTEGSTIGGRVCPPNVFLSFDNMTATGRCLYYDRGNQAQFYNSADGILGEDYLVEWNNSNSGRGSASSYFEGNIKTCADKGMRLPVIYETMVLDPGAQFLPNGDGITPTWASTTNGVPGSDTGSWTQTASASTYHPNFYWGWLWTFNTINGYDHGPYPNRCVLPGNAN